MTKFWSGHRETRRSSQALFPGKGRRFKSGQPHQTSVWLSVFDNLVVVGCAWSFQVLFTIFFALEHQKCKVSKATIMIRLLRGIV
jgi:hypothetical protein